MTDFNIDSLLTQLVKKNVSDVHLVLGEVPACRLDGKLIKTNMPPLTKEQLISISNKVLPKAALSRLDNLFDYDFLYEIKGVSRFRGNFARTSDAPSFVFRVVPYTVPSFEKSGLPVVLKNLANYHNGLILVTGPTGSGKSTTLATILEYINQNYAKHIITAEDPIEFIYQGKKSVFKQRQLAIDTQSFPDAIKYALRQDPDIILVGEIRDKNTASEALKAAETGHLVFSTLHTTDAVQTISRIINFFEPYEREEVKNQIAEVLRCSVAQKLLPKKSGSGRVPALEIMTSSVTIKDYILKDELLSIYDLISNSTNEDMISLNKYLMGLLQKDIITEEVALGASENKNELKLMLQGTFHGAFN